MLRFADFIRFGRLGCIALGASQQDVISELGPPTEVLLQKNPEILKYGPIELSLVRAKGDIVARLKSIAFVFSSGKSLLIPANIEFSDRIPTEQTTEAEFRAYLGEIGEGVPASVSADNRHHLVTNSGVRISFMEGRLRAIHFAGREIGERPAQISLSFPASEIQPIRNEAQRRGKSTAQLAAGYVRAVKAEAGKMALKTDIDAELESDPTAFVNIWKITKIMNDEAGQSAGLVTAKWRLKHDTQKTLYVLSVADPWGIAELSLTPDEIAKPDSIRNRLHELWGELLQQSVGH